MDRLNEFPFASELTDELTLFLEIVLPVEIEVGANRPVSSETSIRSFAEAEKTPIVVDVQMLGKRMKRSSRSASGASSPAGPSTQSVKAIVPPGRSSRAASTISARLSST